MAIELQSALVLYAVIAGLTWITLGMAGPDGPTRLVMAIFWPFVLAGGLLLIAIDVLTGGGGL